jgi:rod shape-determining protein MreD
VKLSRIALLLVAAAVLEFFMGGSPSHGSPVDWFLLATGTVSRSGDFVRAVLAGAAAGFVEDGISQRMLGLNAFAKAVIGYALTIVAVRVVFGGALAVGAALAAAELVNESLVALLSALLLQSPIVILSRDALWRAAATGVTGGALEAAWSFPWQEWWKRRRLRRLR